MHRAALFHATRHSCEGFHNEAAASCCALHQTIFMTLKDSLMMAKWIILHFGVKKNKTAETKNKAGIETTTPRVYMVHISDRLLLSPWKVV